MERLDSRDLTPHLEAALMMAPLDTLIALADGDRYRRNYAVGRLAEYIVSRLAGFQISLVTDGQPDAGQRQSGGDGLGLGLVIP